MPCFVIFCVLRQRLTNLPLFVQLSVHRHTVLMMKSFGEEVATIGKNEWVANVLAVKNSFLLRNPKKVLPVIPTRNQHHDHWDFLLKIFQRPKNHNYIFLHIVDSLKMFMLVPTCIKRISGIKEKLDSFVICVVHCSFTIHTNAAVRSILIKFAILTGHMILLIQTLVKMGVW